MKCLKAEKLHQPLSNFNQKVLRRKGSLGEQCLVAATWRNLAAGVTAGIGGRGFAGPADSSIVHHVAPACAGTIGERN